MLADVVATGDLRRSLEALRDTLARSIDEVDADKRAPLAKQLAEVLVKIQALPVPEEASTVDDLARKRAARRSVPDPPAVDQQRGSRGGRARS